MKNKKEFFLIFLLAIIFIILPMNLTVANNDETITEQQEEFGIGDFIKIQNNIQEISLKILI